MPELDERDIKDYLFRHPYILNQIIMEYFEKHPFDSPIEAAVIMYLKNCHLFSVLGYYYEHTSRSRPYQPRIVKAAESYERAGMWEKALELYRLGIKVCDPYLINIYDDRTGGEVSAVDYPEFNQDVIEEAEALVLECRAKVTEIEDRLANKHEH